jgi:hypothetical protein
MGRSTAILGITTSAQRARQQLHTTASAVSDDMKEGPTPSSMGEIETIYAGGWFHDVHRIRSSQEVNAGCGYRRSGKDYSRDASPQRQQFFRISQGTAKTVEANGRNWTDVGLATLSSHRGSSRRRKSSSVTLISAPGLAAGGLDLRVIGTFTSRSPFPQKIGLWTSRLVVSSVAGANMFCSRGEDRPVKLSAVGDAPAANRLQCEHAGSFAEGGHRPRGHVLAASQVSKQ